MLPRPAVSAATRITVRPMAASDVREVAVRRRSSPIDLGRPERPPHGAAPQQPGRDNGGVLEWVPCHVTGWRGSSGTAGTDAGSAAGQGGTF